MTDKLDFDGFGTDHTVQQVVVGDMESLRPRLIHALERLDYQVLNEQPIQAKRSARGTARWCLSFDPLEYPATLTVSLKRLNAAATLVTFGYQIKSLSVMSGGDRRTLEREAEAIAALAAQRAVQTACAACGTEATDESRFCRRCGVPLAQELAELEVLRLTGGARAGYQLLITGFLSLLVCLFVLFMLFGGDSARAFRVVGILLAFGGSLALLMILTGLYRLHRTLNPARAKDATTLAEAARLPGATSYLELPPTSAQPSVTESTTELLEPVKEPVPVRVKRESGGREATEF